MPTGSQQVVSQRLTPPFNPVYEKLGMWGELGMLLGRMLGLINRLKYRENRMNTQNYQDSVGSKGNIVTIHFQFFIKF